MIHEQHKIIRNEAIRLAGGTKDLAQRARVYHHLYEHSKENFIFPLIAAHGALWGGVHFSRGMKVGRILSYQYLLNSEQRAYKMSDLEAFAEAFREINRQVCEETYTAYHMSRLYGECEGIEKYVSHEFLDLLNKCHHAVKKDKALGAQEKKDLYMAFFIWEQNNIVGRAVDKAVSELNWKVAKYIALKPAIKFRYFPSLKQLYFKDFSDKQERISKGIEAYELAEKKGFPTVVKTLGNYSEIPRNFHRNSAIDFEKLKLQQVTSHAG